MDNDLVVRIANFYVFVPMGNTNRLAHLRTGIRELMVRNGIKGTIILAEEGINGAVCGTSGDVSIFLSALEEIHHLGLDVKNSYDRSMPFRRTEVRVKPEIVSFKRKVIMDLGRGSHVKAEEWNRIISDPSVLVLDARNDYEYRTGTFRGAVNPGIARFSELPGFIEKNVDPEKHPNVAVFCTGGIRCEKVVPFLLNKGFKDVFQLKGGIIRYLEQVKGDDSLWEGECFVFDQRTSLDGDLQKGAVEDLSQRL